MNHFKYEELQIGQAVEFSRIITDNMMEGFRQISGDENPLHVSDDFACQKGFPRRVVYGMLTSSLYSCLGGGCTSQARIVCYKVYMLILYHQYL